MSRKFGLAVCLLLVLTKGVLANPAIPQNKLIVEYKNTLKLSVYGYHQSGLVIDVVEFSTVNPYLLGGYSRKLWLVDAEVLVGPRFNDNGKIMAKVLDFALSGNIGNLSLLGAGEVGMTQKATDKDWLFAKAVINYKNIGVLTTVFKQPQERFGDKKSDSAIKIGPMVTWQWGPYGKLVIVWPFNFSKHKPSALCFQYRKTIEF